MNASLPVSLAPAFAPAYPLNFSTAVSAAEKSAVAAIKTEADQYQTALERFDWDFEFSDDGSTYRRGRDALRALHELQARVDPNGAIWYSYMDAKFGGRTHGKPGPRVGCFA